MSGAPEGVDPLGWRDGERIRDGWLRQPASALSSLGYVAAGAAIAVAAQRRSPALRRRLRWFAGAVAANGIGSLAYHGPGGTGARWLHDAGLVSTLALWLAIDGHELGWRDVPEPVLVAAAALVTARPDTSEVAQTAAGAGIAAAEMARWGTDRHAGRDGLGLAYGLPLAAMAFGGSLHATSRVGGPLHRPDSLLQGHALWHVVTAWALWWWAIQQDGDGA